MSKQLIRYRVPEHSDEIITAHCSYRTIDPLDDAVDAAEDYFYRHDGWESHWPLNIEILADDGEVLGRYEVHCESVPQFTSYEARD